jgi:hypothetical protein
MDRPWKKSYFFGAHFPCEWDERPNFKFGIDLEVLFIYQLIPRKPDFLEWPAIWIPLQLFAFWGGSRGVHGHINHQNACFWVSFDRYALHCVACKIWRWVVYLGSEKWATLYKKLGFKTDQFSKGLNSQLPPFGKRQAIVPLFLDHNSLANGIDNPPSNLT